MLYHHLIHSSAERIARQVVLKGRESGKPGWYTGVEEWLNTLKIEKDVTIIKNITKSSWKKEVKTKIEAIIREVIADSSRSLANRNI